MPKIDFTRPLEVRNSSGVTDRSIKVIATYPNGSFRGLIGPYDNGGILFDENGNYLGCDEGGDRGSALFIRNAKPKERQLTLTAEEMALMRVLVGSCTAAGDNKDIIMKLYQKLYPTIASWSDCLNSVTKSPTVDVQSGAFQRVVKAYSY